MDYNYKNVGKAIRKLRKDKGLTQDELSGLANITRPHLSNIERGIKQANFETVWKLSVAFRKKPHEFVEMLEEEMSKYND